MSSKLTIRCTDFHALQRNTLRGFAVIVIDELKLEIRDITVHQKGDSRWAQLPARPQLRDGVAIKDQSGKIQYTTILQFTNRKVSDAFSSAVVDAVLKYDPDAFAEAAA
jgi:hypothetical protein